MKKIIALFGILLLTGCTTISGIGEDNTPASSTLTAYQPQFSPQQVWSRKTDPSKTVSLFELSHGHIFWQSPIKQKLVAGPAIGNNVVIVGDDNGAVWAFALDSGKILWHVTLSDPIVSPPIISNQSVFVRTLDGSVWALNSLNGNVLWQSPHSVRTMVLSGGSKPILVGDTVVVGSSNGTLTAYVGKTGAVKWQSTIARPQGSAEVEKMVDIVAEPKFSGHVIYVVTYQGNLAAVNAQTGQTLWQTPLSSYTGLAISPGAVFVTDVQGIVWAFDRKTGKQLWKQNYLQFRRITAPAIMGSTIVMGDGEGYVHWLNQSNGNTVARVKVSNASIVSPPVVQNNREIYILSRNGLVSAYTY